MKLYFENCEERQYPDLIEVSQNVIDALDKIINLDELTLEELEEFVGEDMAHHLDNYLAVDNFGIYYKLIGYEVVSIMNQSHFQGQLVLDHENNNVSSSETIANSGN